jgi:hypothetical protein
MERVGGSPVADEAFAELLVVTRSGLVLAQAQLEEACATRRSSTRSLGIFVSRDFRCYSAATRN